MKNYQILFLVGLIQFSIVIRVFSATNTSIATGDWDTSTTWSGGSIPALGNNNIINISTGHTVTKTGDLIINSNNIIFNVYGALVINGTLDVKNNLTFNIFSGGSVEITNLSADQGAGIDISGGGSATITGDLTLGKNGNVNVDGTLTINGNVNVDSGTTLTGGGTVILDGTCAEGTAGAFCDAGPLPVELTLFTANTTGEFVILSWSTASEQNNDYFTLERSRNGKDFEVIGQVDGSGTIHTTMNYSFTDDDPYLGLSFYRLSQTDFDGAFEVFPAISVIFTDKNVGFSINPNPIIDQKVNLKVSGKVKNEWLTLNIIDSQGKLIEHKTFQADYYGNVDVEFLLDKQLQKGIYIFELVSASKHEYLKVVGK